MLQEIAVSAIRPSPTNPRKTFDEAGLEELASSFAEVGVLEPIMVRPVPEEQRNGVTHELVFGERRWRAAQIACLETVPAMVRELDDKQVLEIQIIENDKRADVHPLEQAEGYRALHEEHGYSVDDLAAKVGRSASFIRQRMKLCTLIPEARTAFLQERILPGVAVMLARIPHEDLQRKALEEVLPPKAWDDEDRDGPPISAAEAARIIRDEFMLRLESAPFDRADAALVPLAGACTSCPKRTGAQAELFADVDSPDLCTDAKCYRSKVDAHWNLIKLRAKETRQPILSEAQAKKALYDDGRPQYGSGFVAADAKQYVGEKMKSVKQIVGKDVVPTLARAESGAIVELYPKDLVDKAARAAQKERQQSSGADTKRREVLKRQREAAEREGRERKAVIAAIVDKAKKLAFGDAHWRWLIGELDEALPYHVLKDFRESKGVVESRHPHRDPSTKHKELRDLAQVLKGGDLVALAVEMILQGNLLDDSQLDESAKVFKLDPKTIRDKAGAELAAERKAKAPPAKKAAPAKGAKKAAKRKKA